MKKIINYQLTGTEKQSLKAKEVPQEMLQDYASDEVAGLLNASPQ